MADVSKTIILKYDVDTKKLIDANGRAVTSIKQLTQETQKAVEAARKMGDIDGENTQIVLGSVKHLKNRIAHLKQQREVTATNSEEYQKQTMVIMGLEKELTDMTKTSSDVVLAQKQVGKSTKELNKLQEQQHRAAGLAGAATFELGRTISDLPFGIVAVTNNISQLGTLFAALAANTGSFKGALAAIGTQIMNPVTGALLAFQVITAAITEFAQRSNKAKEEVNKLNLELEAQVQVLEEILRLKKEGAITGEEENRLLENYVDVNKDLVKLTKEGVISEKEKNDILKETLNLFKLRQDDEKAQADRDEDRKRITEEILDLEKEQYATLELRHNEQRRGGTDTQLIATLTEKIQNISDEITAKEAEKADIIRQEANAKADIELLEKDINKQLDDAIKKKERLLELEKQRAGALSDLLDLQVSEAQEGVDQAILEQDEDKFLKHYSRLLELKQEQLSKQREEELKDAKDETVINAVNAKYDILFNKLGKDFSLMFIEGMENIGKDIDTIDIDALYDFGKDSYFSFKKGFEEKFIDEGYEGFFKVFKPEEADPYFGFVDLIDLEYEIAMETEEENAAKLLEKRQKSLDKMSEIFGYAKQGLEIFSQVLTAEADKQLAIEQNRTTALNDQLRERLANEQLSADERDKINQQIARNEGELVKKENEINKKRFEQEKAMNIAMAVIDTFSAATGVLRDTKGGSFARIAGMVAVIASGLANVAAISKQQFVAKAMPNPSLSAQGGESGGSRVFNVVGASAQTQLAEAIAAAEDKPVKAYVVSSDVTTAQELDRKIVEGASI